jgi:hypothetical protein
MCYIFIDFSKYDFMVDNNKLIGREVEIEKMNHLLSTNQVLETLQKQKKLFSRHC